MKNAAFAAAVLLASCLAPIEERKVGLLVEALQDVHQWDPQRGAHASEAYLQLLQIGEKAVRPLAQAIVDPRPTQIMERHPYQVPTVGDAAFLILLEITGARIDDFEDLGARFQPREPNPILALAFETGARARVRDRFLEWFPE